jgi:aminoglycoside phosphotransferase (APT) family kinase protein
MQPLDDVIRVIPEGRRAVATEALSAVAPCGAVHGIAPAAGGASGALTYRVDTDTGAYLLRIEAGRDFFRNPERSYPCLRSAAQAGVAPAVHHADATAGVVVMDFIEQRTLDEHPGGREGLTCALGELVARLQRAPLFPPLLATFGELVDGMLAFVGETGVLGPSRGAAYRHHLDRIRAAYPWDEAQVSAHNDLNPLNILFDGQRLWLVDWELAARNDPFADLAIVVNSLADTPELEALLLDAALDGSPTDRDRARLAAMRQLSCLYYATLMLSSVGGDVRVTEDDTMSVEEFRRGVEDGTIRAGSRDALVALATVNLTAFAEGCGDARFDDVLHALH